MDNEREVVWRRRITDYDLRHMEIASSLRGGIVFLCVVFAMIVAGQVFGWMSRIETGVTALFGCISPLFIEWSARNREHFLFERQTLDRSNDRRDGFPEF